MSSLITPANAGSPLATLSNTPTTTQVGTNANNAQMNQFLTLLTAQLKSQDPMQPTDPTQFVAQLAQFSTVEQLVQGNTTLSGISQGLTGLSLGQYAGLINHTVTATATTVTAPVTSTPQNLTYNVSNTGLTKVSVQVTNSSGTVVRTLPVTGTIGSVAFDGMDDKGNALPGGDYNVALVGTSGTAGSVGKTQPAGTLSSSGAVSSVQQGSNGAWELKLADGRLVTASTVTAVQ